MVGWFVVVGIGWVSPEKEFRKRIHEIFTIDCESFSNQNLAGFFFFFLFLVG